MRVAALSAFAIGVAVLGGSALAAPAKTSFTLVGQSYNVTLPDGFCPMTAATKPIADTLAAIDPQNLTDLTYFDCKLTPSNEGDRRYGILKTPKNSLLMALPPRPAFLKQMGSLITDGSLAKAMEKADVIGQTNKSISTVTGLDLKLSGAPKFIEADDKAVYLLASMSGRLNGGAPTRLAMAGAMTEVKGRIISWYLYAPYRSDADVAQLLHQVKGYIARFIDDNGG